MNIYRQLADASHRSADKPALIAGIGKNRRVLNFSALDRPVDNVATALCEHGLTAGDRVLLAVPASIETYIVMLALLKSGMVIMYIDPAHGASTVARILRQWPPRAIVANKILLRLAMLLPELRRIPYRFAVGGRMRGAVTLDTVAGVGSGSPETPRALADAAILSFTSGSSGAPKAVVRTHGFLRNQLKALRQIAATTDKDIDYVAMPMFVLLNLANRVTSVLPACNMKHPARADPRIVLQQLLRERATRMVASPALLDRLADYCLVRNLLIPDMRCLSTGGGPVGPTLPQRLRAIAPAAILRMVYGSTEAEPIACIDGHEVSVADRVRTREGGGLLVGKPVRGCDVRIVNSAPGQDLGPYTTKSFAGRCLPTGSIGEIVVSGDHVLRGYADSVRDRESKIHVMSSVWHRTGDAGYFDARGRLWLVGRCAAALRDDRGTVYPFQVEYAVSAVRGVRRAALIQEDGDRVLVLEARSRDFRNSCVSAANCVANFGIDRIVTVQRIPVDRRHGAKVDYRALGRLLEGRLGRLRCTIVECLSRSHAW